MGIRSDGGRGAGGRRAGGFGPRRALAVMAMYARMDLGALLRDTKFMVIAVISDICSDVSAIFGVFLIAWRFGGIGGLDRYEVLFMLAFGGIVNGVIAVMDRGNASFPSRIIGRGQWEHMFIMPLPYWAQMAVGFFPFTCSGRLVSGAALMAVAVANLPMALPWWWAPMLLANVLIGVAVVVGLSYLVSSLAFYAPTQCEEIASSLRYSLEYTATFPLSGMPGFMRSALLSAFPAGLIAWFPSMALLGRHPLSSGLYSAAFAAAVAMAASFFFRKGFRHYVRRGINRYMPGGHRN